jgi:hypothetical protein
VASYQTHPEHFGFGRFFDSTTSASLSSTVVAACAIALQIRLARFSTLSSQSGKKAWWTEASNRDLLPTAWKAIGEVLNFIGSDSALSPERVRGYTTQVLGNYPDLELSPPDTGCGIKQRGDDVHSARC